MDPADELWPVEDVREALGEDARAAAQALDRVAARAAGEIEASARPLPIIARLRARTGGTATPPRARPGLPILSNLDDLAFEDLVRRSEHRRYGPDDVIFRRGDLSDGLYVITYGLVLVSDESGETIRKLGPGDVLGEIGVFTDRPRTATATAAASARLLYVSRSAVGEVIERRPEVLDGLLVSLRDRLAASAISGSPFFERLEDDGISDALMSRFMVLDAEAGTVLIQQGEPSPGLFIVADGRLEVTKDGERIAMLEPYEVAGEISLVTRQPAMATVIALEASLLVGLPEEDFVEVCQAHPKLAAGASALAGSRLALLSLPSRTTATF
ncbi:MAG: cyclic nucleotide-binding domain-containing protein [Deltaproteobacteria bacterium]|nr:cyclic nucleotide-binding domain-containing protein [Deltaproteobacteria bacterium]